MTYATVKTPGGEELVVVAKAEFDAMRDALDASEHARAMAEIASGREELLTIEEVAAALAAPTPLAFWRRKRSLTQAALAKTAGISQSYLAALEAGRRKGDPGLFLRLSRALRVRMEDLVDENDRPSA